MVDTKMTPYYSITINIEDVPFILEQMLAEQNYMGNGIGPMWIPVERW